MVFGDHVHELRSFALSEKFFDELKSTVLSDLTHEYSKNIESLLVTLNHLFSQESSRMMVDNGVYPIIKGQMIYLMKDVLPYEIKAWGKTFEFTECTLGCRIWWSGKDFNSGDMVIYPQNKRYRHPHAYADNRLCMNGFSGKGKGLHRVVTILKGAEYVLKHGYKPESTTNDLRRWETTRGGFR